MTRRIPKKRVDRFQADRYRRVGASLLGELVFVGGAATERFFTSPVAARIRMTEDVARSIGAPTLGGSPARALILYLSRILS